MIDALNSILGWLVFLSIYAVFFGAVALGPEITGSDRWIRRRVLDPLGTRYYTWARRRAARRLDSAYRHLPPHVVGEGEGRGVVTEAVNRWYECAPFAAGAQAVRLMLWTWGLLNVGWLVSRARGLWKEVLEASASGNANFLAWMRDAGGWLGDKSTALLSPASPPWDRPRESLTALFVILLLIMILRALRAAAPAFDRVHDFGTPGRYQRISPRFELIGSFINVRFGDTARYRAVVRLLACAGAVGHARARYDAWTGEAPMFAPRVNLSDAERVIWSAWRMRHFEVRRVRRRQLKEHAADVVGALRAAEARQDTDPDIRVVFDDLAKMLLKVAERYAVGRTAALLDSEDLTGVTKAVNREWVRLVALGVAVVGAAVGASLLGLPDSAASPIIGIVALAAVGLIYGSRFLPSDLVDIVRGQSRK
ncbi:hypothetical protein MUU72_11695 [Streptomyces sp. RS10V-4]|uniref:hypothetical protein n=1 Tax=Streptomyces rhizoryzae TaxID=2932493 RepID=UPI00200567B1|nr:hypothetical protein [Streptomyces rhizoryzae]MCK7623751.1 hypothetical protein [Streptomyces rhizoryzae]